jgi:hypothetical protein
VITDCAGDRRSPRPPRAAVPGSRREHGRPHAGAMLCCAVLCCAVLYCAVLCCAVLFVNARAVGVRVRSISQLPVLEVDHDGQGECWRMRALLCERMYVHLCVSSCDRLQPPSLGGIPHDRYAMTTRSVRACACDTRCCADVIAGAHVRHQDAREAWPRRAQGARAHAIDVAVCACGPSLITVMARR